MIDDDDRFRTATDSALAFGRIASLVKKEAEACDEDHPGGRCDDLFAAAAIAQVSGVLLVNCRLPDVFDARAVMATYLRGLRDGKSPKPPPTPAC